MSTTAKLIIAGAYFLFAIALIVWAIIAARADARKAHQRNRLTRRTLPEFNHEDADEATECYINLTSDLSAIRITGDDVLLPVVMVQWCGDNPRFTPTDLTPTLHIDRKGLISGALNESIIAPVPVHIEDPTKPCGSRFLTLYISVDLLGEAPCAAQQVSPSRHPAAAAHPGV